MLDFRRDERNTQPPTALEHQSNWGSETYPRPPAHWEQEKWIQRCYSKDENVNLRRQIVELYPKSAEVLCDIFDEHHIQLPQLMIEAGSWKHAYKSKDVYRPAIQTMISKDRRQIRQSR